MLPIEEIKPQQSIELLKSLHILTRDGKINQDSRRKLKQVYHLYHFIEPILTEIKAIKEDYLLVDHGAGKSYIGFIFYDLFVKLTQGRVVGVDSNPKLIEQSEKLAKALDFDRLTFVQADIQNSVSLIKEAVHIVTALHACDTATDDALHFAISKRADYAILIPCCQAEVASYLKRNKAESLKSPLAELWRHGIHTREMGSHVTNVLRCLLLESEGYQVTVTELVGWEHSMKNELIIAKRTDVKKGNARDRNEKILQDFSLEALKSRFLI